MPGDELVDHPRYRSTRAIHINAASTQVWPWLVQMGQGRGGLYSYDWLENLFGLHMHSADTVEPALQGLAVGDLVRLVPEGYPSWTFQLVDQADDRCRLVVRFQADFAPTLMGRVMYKYALTPVHFVMERKMLLGIKKRVEGAT